MTLVPSQASVNGRSLIGRLPEVTVWGMGTRMRGFTHIEDCLVTRDEVDDARAINLTTSKPTSFLEFVQ